MKIAYAILSLCVWAGWSAIVASPAIAAFSMSGNTGLFIFFGGVLSSEVVFYTFKNFKRDGKV